MYARKELVILDDVFSGLDADTEEQIFDRLFSTANGLFVRNRISVMLVTHAVHRLPYSDHVISLNATGRVLEQGTYDQLKKSGGYVESLATQTKSEDASQKSTSVEEDLQDTKSSSANPEVTEFEIEAEELKRQTGDFAVYRYYFASIGWRINLPFFIMVLLYGVCSRMTQFLLTYCK